MPSKVDREEADIGGMAVASFMLISNLFSRLAEAGELNSDDAFNILRGTMLALEKQDEVSDPIVHQARAFLSALAVTIGLPTRPPQ